MGADIHIYAERKLKDGTWAMSHDLKNFMDGKALRLHMSMTDPNAKYELHWCSPRIGTRNYQFFAALAGVRGEGPEARGLPDDVSPLVAEEAENWDGDGHSFSWYSARDMVPIFMEYHMSEPERAELVSMKVEGSNFDMTQRVLEKYIGIDVPYGKDNIQDVDALRFVFWFDN